METITKNQEVIMLPDGRMNARNAAIYAGLSEKTMAMMRCEALRWIARRQTWQR